MKPAHFLRINTSSPAKFTMHIFRLLWLARLKQRIINFDHQRYTQSRLESVPSGMGGWIFPRAKFTGQLP